MKRVLFVIGRKNSSFEQIWHAVAPRLVGRFDCDLLVLDDSQPDMANRDRLVARARRADLVFFLWWGACIAFRHCLPADVKVLVGFYDQSSLELGGASFAAQAGANMVCVANRGFLRLAQGLPVPVRLCVDGVDAKRFSPRLPGRARLPQLFGWCGNSAVALAYGANGRVPAGQEDLKGVGILRAAFAGFESRAGLVLLDRAKDAGVPHADMPEWYRSIGCYCCASLHEGTPNPVLEAAASGLPIITTPVGVVPDLLGVSGVCMQASGEPRRCHLDEPTAFVVGLAAVVVERRTPEAFRAAMRWVLDHPDAATEMGQEARRRVLDRWEWNAATQSHLRAGWSWDVQALQYDAMFSELLGEPEGA